MPFAKKRLSTKAYTPLYRLQRLYLHAQLDWASTGMLIAQKTSITQGLYTNCHRSVIMKTGYVYILTNKRHGTLYIGVTNSIIRRMGEHRSMTEKSFTCRYSLHRLVYLETYDRITDAIAREKQLKKWNRSWKIALIERMNPGWKDLFLDICEW